MAEKKPRYARVLRRMMSDAKVMALSTPQPNGLSLWRWLLTCREGGILPGVVVVSLAAAAHACGGWPVKRFLECFAELGDMAKADWRAGLVWLPRALDHDPPANVNVVKSWRRPWDEMPECALKDEIESVLRTHCAQRGELFLAAFDNLTGNGIDNGTDSGSGNQSTDNRQQTTDNRSTLSRRDARAAPESLIEVRPEAAEQLHELEAAVLCELRSHPVLAVVVAHEPTGMARARELAMRAVEAGKGLPDVQRDLRDVASQGTGTGWTEAETWRKCVAFVRHGKRGGPTARGKPPPQGSGDGAAALARLRQVDIDAERRLASGAEEPPPW